MKIYKKLTALFLALLFVLASIPVAPLATEGVAAEAGAAAQVTLTTSVSKATVYAGDTITVTASLDEAVNTTAMGLIIDGSYDADAFSITAPAWTAAVKEPRFYSDDYSDEDLAGTEEMILSSVSKNVAAIAYTLKDENG